MAEDSQEETQGKRRSISAHKQERLDENAREGAAGFAAALNEDLVRRGKNPDHVRRIVEVLAQDGPGIGMSRETTEELKRLMGEPKGERPVGRTYAHRNTRARPRSDSEGSREL